jgi:hypothetical protein
MQDDLEPSLPVQQTASSDRTLRRVADTLGVPVSSFGGGDTEVTPLHGRASPEEAALLAMVHSYLKRAEPTARARFVAAVQTMVKLPSA